MKIIVLIFLLAPLSSIASQDYEISHVVMYSTSAQKLIRQVNSVNGKFFNYQECDLVADPNGEFEYHSTSNCKLISSKWLYLDDVSIDEASKRFTNRLKKEASGESTKSKVYLAISAVSAAMSVKLYNKANKSSMNGGMVPRVLGSIIFAFTSVTSAVVSYFSYEPSLEEALSNSDIAFENNAEIESLSDEIYYLVRDSLDATINEMGVFLQI